jgi:hypothetical protein
MPLRGLGKDQIPQLGEHGGGKAQQSIGRQQTHGDHQHGLRLPGLISSASTRCLSKMGTPTLASLAQIMNASAASACHL